MTPARILALAAAGVLCPLTAPAQMLSGDPAWMARKCALYTEAWTALGVTDGAPGIGAAFLTRHSAFLASGCRAEVTVCPVSPAEIALADTVSLMAVAEGMAGSFLPFACP